MGQVRGATLRQLTPASQLANASRADALMLQECSVI